ncbi:MAG: hypothetical protein CMG08_02410 [Candidatus Marinimicrobia bacterium]|nr:hypothetical protein [Candidatus Neomarinimicrobiota bacterium]
MKNTIIFLSLFISSFFIMSCGDNDTEKSIDQNIIEVITGDPNDDPFYYNFLNQKEDSTNWQLSYFAQSAGQGYFMPSIDLDKKILLYVENDMSFDEIKSVPASVFFKPGAGKLSNGGEFEVLSYDMTIHKIGVSDKSFIIFDTTSERAFKLRFEDYSNWVLTFQYVEL